MSDRIDRYDIDRLRSIADWLASFPNDDYKDDALFIEDVISKIVVSQLAAEQFTVADKVAEKYSGAMAGLAAVPEGFVLVPVEPTEAMLKALLKGARIRSYNRKGMNVDEWSYVQEGWDAMLATLKEQK